MDAARWREGGESGSVMAVRLKRSYESGSGRSVGKMDELRGGGETEGRDDEARGDGWTKRDVEELWARMEESRNRKDSSLHLAEGQLQVEEKETGAEGLWETRTVVGESSGSNDSSWYRAEGGFQSDTSTIDDMAKTEEDGGMGMAESFTMGAGYEHPFVGGRRVFERLGVSRRSRRQGSIIQAEWEKPAHNIDEVMTGGLSGLGILGGLMRLANEGDEA
jgi:hypothetical protein